VLYRRPAVLEIDNAPWTYTSRDTLARIRGLAVLAGVWLNDRFNGD